MANSAEVRIEGLAELRRALRKAEDTDSLTGVREALKDGARLVAADAAGRVPVVSGRARSSLRATAGGNRAYVVGGRKTVPYFGWLDFGSRTPKRGQARSRGPWSASGSGPSKGRFIYPAIDARVPEMVRKVADALREVVSRG